MRKLKKLLAVASVAAMTLSLCACGGKKDDTYTVGICQLVQHEALDAATKGFKDALVEELVKTESSLMSRTHRVMLIHVRRSSMVL